MSNRMDEHFFCDLVRFIDLMAMRGSVQGHEFLEVGNVRSIIVEHIHEMGFRLERDSAGHLRPVELEEPLPQLVASKKENIQ